MINVREKYCKLRLPLVFQGIIGGQILILCHSTQRLGRKNTLKNTAGCKKNAAKYGFIQVYTAGRKGEGYFEERWHWSYFPVAQALLDYAKTHEKKIDKALNAQWKGAEKYQYIQKQWQSYVFNVNEKPWF